MEETQPLIMFATKKLKMGQGLMSGNQQNCGSAGHYTKNGEGDSGKGRSAGVSGW